VSLDFEGHQSPPDGFCLQITNTHDFLHNIQKNVDFRRVFGKNF